MRLRLRLRGRGKMITKIEEEEVVVAASEDEVDRRVLHGFFGKGRDVITD